MWEKLVDEDSSNNKDSSTFTIENHFLRLTFSNSTGQLQSIFNKVSNVQSDLQNNFFNYLGDPDMFANPEGAYLFVPLGPAYPIRNTPKSFQVIQV
jgi:hypothetical protein